VNLTRVHQIVIAAAGVLAALFSFRSLLNFSRGAGMTQLGLALAAAALAVGAVTYLRHYRRKLAGR